MRSNDDTVLAMINSQVELEVFTTVFKTKGKRIVPDVDLKYDYPLKLCFDPATDRSAGLYAKDTKLDRSDYPVLSMSDAIGYTLTGNIPVKEYVWDQKIGSYEVKVIGTDLKIGCTTLTGTQVEQLYKFYTDKKLF